MERNRKFRLMKSIKCILIIISLILSVFIVYKFFDKKVDLYDCNIYIEAINDNKGSRGSGFVYKVENNKAYIITCYHVIEGYNDIYVYNINNKKVKANLFKYDEYTDIAILEINNTLNLKKVKIGDSNKINKGDNIYIISNSLNKESLTNGVITFIDKKITFNTTHGSSNVSAIEIDANIVKGNSGGLVLNYNSEAIGMIFLKEADLNDVAFALPINFIMDIVSKLENNELNRPNLGAIMTNTTNVDLIREYGLKESNIEGVILLYINGNSILDNAGLINGDIITRFNNIDINNVNELREELYKKVVGDTVNIEYYRDDIYYKVNVKL